MLQDPQESSLSGKNALRVDTGIIWPPLLQLLMVPVSLGQSLFWKHCPLSLLTVLFVLVSPDCGNIHFIWRVFTSLDLAELMAMTYSSVDSTCTSISDGEKARNRGQPSCMNQVTKSFDRNIVFMVKVLGVWLKFLGVWSNFLGCGYCPRCNSRKVGTYVLVNNSSQLTQSRLLTSQPD